MRLERERAQKPCRPAQVIDRAIAARCALGARRASLPLLLIPAHGRSRIVRGIRQSLRQHRGVLDRHRGALGKIGQHRMRCVPQQGHRVSAPARERRAVVERPLGPLLGGGQNRARFRCPPSRGISGEDFRALPRGAPAGLAPLVADDGNDINEGAASHGIVHEVSIVAQPKLDRGCPLSGGPGVGGSKGAPSRVACKLRDGHVAEAPAQARPQPVGRDQGGAALLECARGVGGDGDATAVRREVLDPGAEFQRNTGMRAHGFQQHGLQIAAMDDPVGRAIAFGGGDAERRPRQHPCRLRVHDPKLLGGDHVRAQLRPQAKRKQHV